MVASVATEAAQPTDGLLPRRYRRSFQGSWSFHAMDKSANRLFEQRSWVWSCYGACCSNPQHSCKGRAAPELQALPGGKFCRICSAPSHWRQEWDTRVLLGWDGSEKHNHLDQEQQFKAKERYLTWFSMAQRYQRVFRKMLRRCHPWFLLQTSFWMWTSVSGRERRLNVFLFFLWVINLKKKSP